MASLSSDLTNLDAAEMCLQSEKQSATDSYQAAKEALRQIKPKLAAVADFVSVPPAPATTGLGLITHLNHATKTMTSLLAHKIHRFESFASVERTAKNIVTRLETDKNKLTNEEKQLMENSVKLWADAVGAFQKKVNFDDTVKVTVTLTLPEQEAAGFEAYLARQRIQKQRKENNAKKKQTSSSPSVEVVVAEEPEPRNPKKKSKKEGSEERVREGKKKHHHVISE